MSKIIKITFVVILILELTFSIIYSQIIVELNGLFQQSQSQVSQANELNLDLTQKLSEITSIKSLLASSSAKNLKPITNVLY
ncbi:MAG: hypothetical protein WCV93_02635 [Candidatus Shapirobacteria bacterium]|jgi:cell division protein FtsL